ncbi:MAG: nicotinate phosphoribosyltransferase [Candidatus Omnitrophica bacterium]|nr:nicotinate phosphoribosyltransferase [Candidatus Omnitrophota bacterium]
MPENTALLTDLYEFTMSECFLRYKKDTRATFDLFVRQLPESRAYMVFCGLQDILAYISGLKFQAQDLEYLESLKIFSGDFLEYLSAFKFKGDVWAMAEGEVFFPGEPVIRVTASVIEAQLIESFLLNTVNLQTMIASKASRVVAASGGKGLYDFSLRRTHGMDAGIKVARSSYIAGFCGTSNVLAGKLYKIPVAGTMAHSFVMSFENEKESFKAYCSVFPDRSILLVDTYSTPKGIQNAVKVALELKKRGHSLQGIRLDSGDIDALSRLARKALDEAGLNSVKIFASGNLDELKINKLVSLKAPVDNFGVGTNMGTSADAPYLDVIYKLSEVTGKTGDFLPTMKLSHGKVTYPGRKQVFRLKDKRGVYLKDVLALEKEKIKGKALLQKVIEAGEIVHGQPSLDKIREYSRTQLRGFAKPLSDIHSKYEYPVEVSAALVKLTSELKAKLSKRQ